MNSHDNSKYKNEINGIGADANVKSNESNKRQRVIVTSPDSSLSNNINDKQLKMDVYPTNKRNNNNVQKNMSKEEISAYRKEQRRIRNRISAAASRQKVKNRINELEKEVLHLQTKYNLVLDRLLNYEPSFTINDDQNATEALSSDTAAAATTAHHNNSVSLIPSFALPATPISLHPQPSHRLVECRTNNDDANVNEQQQETYDDNNDNIISEEEPLIIHHHDNDNNQELEEFLKDFI